MNALFPAYLAGGMHGVDNIDDSGILSLVGMGLDASEETKTLNDAAEIVDKSTKNVADWDWDDAEPIAFNHLTGHYTEALESTASGGSDQSASWGGTPIIRPAVSE